MKRKFTVKASKSIKAAAETTKVAQITIDIAHDGDYNLDEIEDAISRLGYEVMGIDSTDVTNQY